MKKLYNNKGKIHPSPPSNADQFSLLPAAIITLAAALSPQDKEVLAYLISCSCSSSTSTNGNNFSGNPKSSITTKVSGSGGDHAVEFSCDCFRCYMSYWVRWDASPNRDLIHEIIEAYEDGVFNKKVVKSRKDGRRKRVSDVAADDRGGGSGEVGTAVEMDMNLHNSEVEETATEDEKLDCEQSGLPCTVRRLASFMGERIWGVWGII